jgi:hypothetical protein
MAAVLVPPKVAVDLIGDLLGDPDISQNNPWQNNTQN